MHRLFLILILILFQGCEKRFNRAPIEQGVFSDKIGFTNKEHIVVLPGDTLINLSQRYNVSVRELIEANNLEPPFLIRPGDVLNFPKKYTYIIKKNDTLLEIADCFGMDLKDLLRSNNIK